MHMVATAAAHDIGPIAFRYPRGAGTGGALPERGEILEIGRGRVIRDGEDVAILSFGAHLATCRSASALLEAEGISATLADARFARPLDTDLLMRLVGGHRALVTVEQGAEGGFGSIVMHELARRGAFDTGLILRNICLPDRFIEQATPEEMYENAGMTAADIAARVRDALKPQSRRVVPLRRV